MARKGQDLENVMAPQGDTTRMIRGETLLAFCETYGLRISNAYTPQKNKATWKHWSWVSTHAIDHFMVRREDPKNVCKTLTLHKEVVREAGLEDWSLHMDNNPIEVTMEIGREWQEEAEEGRTILKRMRVWTKSGGTRKSRRYGRMNMAEK